jgi:predicted phage terminase large subunit-like protein
MPRKPKPNNEHAAVFRLAQGSLAAYASLLWSSYGVPAHLRLLISKLEDIEAGRVKRLVITMPPRHGKSMTASEFFPAWYLGRNPAKAIIATSYGQELALDFGRKVRNLMLNPLHGAIFPGSMISDDSSAAHRFNLTANGVYRAVGAGGPITGRGADLFLVDDPIKDREQAFSSIQRANLQNWYQAVAYSRLEPDAAIILIQTRWHEDDLCGWLLREHTEEGWQVINLPALAEANDPLGRAEGTALWPGRYPVERLQEIRAAVGGATFASLYQQRPAAIEGAIFKREWWKTWTKAMLPSRFEQIIVSLDTAFKTGTDNDYSVAIVMGVASNGFYILDVLRERLEYPDLRRRVEGLAARWFPNSVLIEDKASGQSLIQSLRAETRLPIKPVRVDGDKVSRANAITPLVESGRVFLPEAAPWLADFVDELSSFPAGAHDDCVDALTQALNFVRILDPPMLVYYRALANGEDLTTKPMTVALEETAAYKAMAAENQRPCLRCGRPLGASKIPVTSHGGAVHNYDCVPAQRDSFGRIIFEGPGTVLEATTGIAPPGRN